MVNLILLENLDDGESVFIEYQRRNIKPLSKGETVPNLTPGNMEMLLDFRKRRQQHRETAFVK